jgi:RNA 3'-terminal phosphate cyclase
MALLEKEGGQILRTATALAAVLKIPCRVFNIRKGREKARSSNSAFVGVEGFG